MSQAKSDDDDDDPLKNNKELFGNVGSVNINQSNHHHHHHQDLSGNAAAIDNDDGDDIEVIHSEVVSLDLKNLGTPVYEGSSTASKNISEEIPDNISTSYSASSSQSKYFCIKIVSITLCNARLCFNYVSMLICLFIVLKSYF